MQGVPPPRRVLGGPRMAQDPVPSQPHAAWCEPCPQPHGPPGCPAHQRDPWWPCATSAPAPTRMCRAGKGPVSPEPEPGIELLTQKAKPPGPGKSPRAAHPSSPPAWGFAGIILPATSPRGRSASPLGVFHAVTAPRRGTLPQRLGVGVRCLETAWRGQRGCCCWGDPHAPPQDETGQGSPAGCPRGDEGAHRDVPAGRDAFPSCCFTS